MIFLRCLHAWLEESNPLSVFLPLVVKGLFAVITFGVPCLVWLWLDPRKSSQQHESSSKGATP